MRSNERIRFWYVPGSDNKDRSFGGGSWASTPEGFTTGGREKERKESKRKKREMRKDRERISLTKRKEEF